jgi:hypothetical protein
MWKTEFIGKKWLNINEELVYRKIKNCTNKTHKNTEKYLNRINLKWENKFIKIVNYNVTN